MTSYAQGRLAPKSFLNLLHLFHSLVEAPVPRHWADHSSVTLCVALPPEGIKERQAPSRRCGGSQEMSGRPPELLDLMNLSRSSVPTSTLCGSDTENGLVSKRAGDDGDRQQWGRQHRQGWEGCDQAVIVFRQPPIIPSPILTSHLSPPPPSLTKQPQRHHQSGCNFCCLFIHYLRDFLLPPGNASLRNLPLGKGPSASKLYLDNWGDRYGNVCLAFCDFQGKC